MLYHPTLFQLLRPMIEHRLSFDMVEFKPPSTLVNIYAVYYLDGAFYVKIRNSEFCEADIDDYSDSFMDAMIDAVLEIGVC